MSEGGGDGCGIGDGAYGDVAAGDADCAEIAPYDHGAAAHDRHHPPAFITFDYTPTSPAPLEAIGVIQSPVTPLPAPVPRREPARPEQPGLWARFFESVAFWR